MKPKPKIKDLPKIERPREKLIKYGPEKLPDSELLAILLRTGKKGENVIELASKLIKKFGEIGLQNLAYDSLKNYPGLGQAKACEIVACFELGKRFLRNKKTKIYLSPKEIWEELRDLRSSKKEHFVIFYLDSRNKEVGREEIKKEIISVGSLNANLVHPREVFEPAVRNLAAHIILAHNHPSGDTEPSEDDLAITKRLVEAGKILGIEVVDHIIVARDGFLSFKERGLL